MPKQVEHMIDATARKKHKDFDSWSDSRKWAYRSEVMRKMGYKQGKGHHWSKKG